MLMEPSAWKQICCSLWAAAAEDFRKAEGSFLMFAFLQTFAHRNYHYWPFGLMVCFIVLHDSVMATRLGSARSVATCHRLPNEVPP